MSTLVTADLHLNDSPLDEYRHTFMEQELPRLIDKHKVQRLLLLGDFTEKKRGHSAELVNRIVDHFVRLSQLCPLILQSGNHDCTNPYVPFFKFTDHLSNITWINRPTEMELPELGRCLFLPHTRHHVDDWKGFDFKQYDFIGCHQTFNSAQVGFGRGLEGIPSDIFPADALVLSGDIHYPQQVGPVTYCGAPYRIAFGDAYDPRIILLTDTELVSIPCRGHQKCLVVAKDAASLWRLSIATGSIVKCTVACPKGDLGTWPAILREVQAWAAENGVILHSVHPVLEAAAGARIATQAVRKTDGELVQTYVQRRGVSTKVLTTGMELIK